MRCPDCEEFGPVRLGAPKTKERVHGRSWVLREDRQRGSPGSIDHEAFGLEVPRIRCRATSDQGGHASSSRIHQSRRLYSRRDAGRNAVARLGRTLGAREFAPTLEIKVNFITPAKVGRVLGTGRIVCRGCSICFMEGQLHDENGNHLASATATSKVGRLGGEAAES